MASATPLRVPDFDQPTWIRPIIASDLAALKELADELDTINLPSDREALGELIARSETSFAQFPAVSGTVGAMPFPTPSYTLVAESAGQLLGTASVFAVHGTPDDPHYALRVDAQTVHSHQLGVDRQRTMLTLIKDQEPWTELGALVVRPSARGRGLGKLLLAARFLLIAMHPQAFCRRLIAELLPPRREDGGNAFWDAVGGPLTGLEYYRADLLCRTDKEFIEAFFPHEELVADLLPPAARALIGREGPTTTPVRALLARAGFRWLNTIDPFDAGPHDGAALDEIIPLRSAHRVVRLESPPRQPTTLLVGSATTHHFAIVPSDIIHDGMCLSTFDADRLGIPIGGTAWTLDMSW